MPPARSHPQESATVAFQLGQPITNPFAGYANDLLQRQASSLASHPPLHWSTAALAAAAQPPSAAGAAQQARPPTSSFVFLQPPKSLPVTNQDSVGAASVRSELSFGQKQKSDP